MIVFSYSVERFVNYKVFISRVVSNNGGRPPHTFKAFQTVASVLGSPPRPVDDPNFSKVEFNVPKDFEDRFTLPSLEEMG